MTKKEACAKARRKSKERRLIGGHDLGDRWLFRFYDGDMSNIPFIMGGNGITIDKYNGKAEIFPYNGPNQLMLRDKPTLDISEFE